MFDASKSIPLILYATVVYLRCHLCPVWTLCDDQAVGQYQRMAYSVYVRYSPGESILTPLCIRAGSQRSTPKAPPRSTNI